MGLPSLKCTVAPAELPLTLDEVKTHLKVTGSADDADILLKIYAAVSQCDGNQGLLNRALVTQTWEMKIDGFPCGVIELPLPPLQSVSSIVYLDADGASQTLAADAYRVLNAGVPMRKGLVEPAYGQSWPTTRDVSQAVTVTFVAGYGARNAVPWHTRALLLFAIKELYDHRTPLTENSPLFKSPAYQGLFDLARFPVVG